MSYTITKGPFPYMGTKVRIAPDVASIIRRHGGGRIVDPFAGMGAVAMSLAGGPNVMLSDALRFIAHLAQVRFTNAAPFTAADAELLAPHFRRHQKRLSAAVLNRKCGSTTQERMEQTRRYLTDSDLREQASELRRLNDDKVARYQMATLYYADSYFSIEQCIEIDALRYAIDQYGEDRRAAMIAGLISACARCINSTGHSAQYLKATSDAARVRVDEKWRRSVWGAFLAASSDVSPIGTRQWRAGNQVRCGSATDVLAGMDAGSCEAVYMDPPYTKDHYSRFYHVYEELLLYRYPEVSGIGIYPDQRFASPFSIKSKAIAAYKDLFAQAGRVAPGLVVSFPIQTFLGATEDVLVPLIKETHKVKSIERISHEHSSLGGSTGQAQHEVTELVIDCEALAQ